MGSSEPAAPESRKPGRDTALRQLLRPLEPYLARPEVTELAVNQPGELWVRSCEGWTRHDVPELSPEYLDALAIWNDGYDPEGRRNVSRTASPDVNRVLWR